MYGWEQRVLLRHYLEQSLSITAIAEQGGATAARSSAGWPPGGSTATPSASTTGPRSTVATKLDQDKPLIRERLTTYPALTWPLRCPRRTAGT